MPLWLQTMKTEILAYNNRQTATEKEICDLLATTLTSELPEAENKIWHRHPVWFLNGNPVAGYTKQKAGVRLMFWSGADFGDDKLQPGTGKFKDASIFYTSAEQVDMNDIKTWLQKAKTIRWDYKNLVKRKGQLEKLAP